MEDLAEPGSDEVPFSLPSTWLWTRIGLAVNLVNGRAFKPKDWSATGLPIIRIQNLNNPNAGYNYCAFPVDPKHHLSPGDFLISWSGTPGTSFGAFIWHGPAGVLNQHIFRAEVYGAAYELAFLKIAINARLDEMIAQAHGGVGLQHITKGKLEALAIPLPSLAEQKRIVAKVDQLMALCDELEAKQTKKRETGARLTKSALDALTSAEGPDEFDAAWKRVVENFDVLIDRAEKVGELRGAIVSLALRGKLCQGSEGDALSELRGQPEVVPEGKRPHPVPRNWAWLYLDQLVESITDGDHQPPPKAAAGVAFLTIGNVSSGRLDFSETRFVSRDYFEKLDRRRVPAKGDILYTVVGATYGRPVKVQTDREFCVQRHIAILRPDGSCDSDYLYAFLGSADAYAQATKAITGTAQPTVALRPLRRFLVPLPPKAEQRAIVTRLEQLMKVCDDLEAKLRQAEDRAAKLVEAVVRELVA